MVEAKIWKIEASSDSSIPTPLSVTVIRAVAVSASQAVETTTRAAVAPFGGVDGVGHDVQDRAVDAVGVEEDLGQVGGGLPVERDAQLLGARLHQLDDVGHVAFRSAGSRAGSRSLENESMSMTRL